MYTSESNPNNARENASYTKLKSLTNGTIAMESGLPKASGTSRNDVKTN